LGEPEQYWDLPFVVGPEMERMETERELIERLKNAVRLRLIADVPLGAFLSGGVDSSAVVSMMAELVAEPVKTCSISFGDPEFNEASYASSVAQQYGTDHSERQVDPDDLSLVELLASIYDEPYADSSAIPTYRVCELARSRVTVALSGDGGDENFAGYRRYRWHGLEEIVRRTLPAPIRRPLFGMAGSIYPKLDWAPKILRAKSTLQGIARDSLDGYLHSVSLMPDQMRRRLYSPDLNRELQGYRAIEVFKHHAERAPTDHPISLVQYLDFKTYLPGDILTKVDRASMAHSLEVRVPMLDYEFVAWVSSLRPDVKLRRREGKYILKHALATRLSQEILFRPKMGFAVPLASWFRGPLREQLRSSLLQGVLPESGLFEYRQLERLVDEHGSGARDHSAPLWSLLMLAAFQKKAAGA
jgi:asparagine synthase (glutamine-hydrolysing)